MTLLELLPHRVTSGRGALRMVDVARLAAQAWKGLVRVTKQGRHARDGDWHATGLEVSAKAVRTTVRRQRSHSEKKKGTLHWTPCPAHEDSC